MAEKTIGGTWQERDKLCLRFFDSHNFVRVAMHKTRNPETGCFWHWSAFKNPFNLSCGKAVRGQSSNIETAKADAMAAAIQIENEVKNDG